MRSLVHISKQILKVAAVLLAGSVLVFFALTRTQVGRDGLRAELERQFDAAFAGRLEVGALQGNLLNDLFASDVVLYDAEGRAVVTVDSVVVRPRWSGLLARRFEARRLVLIRPSVDLVRGPDGSWNVASALRPVTPRPATVASPWGFNSAAVEVVDGRVTTRNRGEAPPLVARGALFDYARTTVTGIDALARLDLAGGAQSVELDRARAALPGLALSLDTLAGRIDVRGSRLEIDGVRLALGETRLRLGGAADLPSLLAADPGAEVRLALEGSADFESLRRLVPALPLAAEADVAARLAGTLGALTAEEVVLARGGTRLRGEGTVLGLPEALDVDLLFSDNVARARDLAPLLPGVDLSPLRRLGTLSFTLGATGTAPARGDPLSRFRAALDVDARSDAGRLAGRLDLRRADDTLRHSAALRFADLDPSRLTGRPADAGRLTGRVRSEGAGATPSAFTGGVDLLLGPSVLASRSVDSLIVRTTSTAGRWDGSAWLRSGAGRAAIAGTLDLAAAVPAYRATLRTTGLDLGPFARVPALATRLDATVELDGAGFTGDALTGRFEARLDSSSVVWSGTARMLPASDLVLSLDAAPEGGRTLVVGGDALAGRVQGLRFDAGTAALVRLWAAALQDAAHTLLDKPYPRPQAASGPAAPADLLPLDIPPPPADLAILRGIAERALASDPASRRLDATLTVRRPEVVAALMPFLPAFRTDATSEVRVRADLDALDVDAVATAARFSTSAGEAWRPRGEVQGTLRLGPEPVADRMELLVGVQADSAEVRGRAVTAPRVLLRHAPGGGALAASLSGPGGLQLRLDAALALLPTQNRLHLRTLDVAARGYGWRSEGGTVDLYADAVAVDELRLVSGTDAAPQHLRLDGVFSTAPTDTVVLDVEAVQLRELSALAGLPRPVGGRLGGRIALTGGLRQPVVAGGLGVGALTFDDRLLGRLAVESRFVPGAPDVELEASLVPLPEGDSLREDLAGMTEEPNRLVLAGTVRLPDAVDRGGALDLGLTAERGDLFVLEYLFPGLVDGVEGFAEGTGRIAGTFRRPVFEADLAVRDGAFRVPAFGLAYTAEAALRVDAEGLHITRARLADAGGGVAGIDGSLLFNDYRYFSLDLTGRLDGLELMDVPSSPDLPFYGRLRASGTATLEGPLSSALLRSEDARTTEDSELYIPLTTGLAATDPGFIVFADSSGALPDFRSLTARRNVLSQRPAGERTFLAGLDMDLAIFAPPGSTVHLVIDPLLGDVINAVGSGRIQLQRSEGEFTTYGTFDVASGDYLFTAGDVFYRRFLIEGGSITWDGDPTDAALAITAAYRTRASRAGLAGTASGSGLIPVVVWLNIGGRVSTPTVDLGLGIDQRDRGLIGNVEVLEAALNQPERATEYATSVLLTNSFLLTTELTGSTGTERADTRNQLAFTSLSGLVSSQVNRYLSGALPALDLNFGVQGENAQDLDVTYGVALRLLDERLVIRGEGIYGSERSQRNPREFVVEVRLSPSVSVEVFYRRESDLLSDGALTETTGAGLSYQTQFTNWQRLLRRLFGLQEDEAPPPDAPEVAGGT